ncbi:MAG: protein YgfX [Thalassotalea sp.]
MKTLNSTTWSNLYSGELKYNLTVKPSIAKAACLAVFIFVNVLLGSLLVFQVFSINLLALFFIGVVLVLMGWWSFNYFKLKQKTVHYNLNIMGMWEEINKQGIKELWQVDATSRVAFYGCYISLTTREGLNNQLSSFQKKNKQVFIFKDSLSVKSYARLCRVIHYVNSY